VLKRFPDWEEFYVPAPFIGIEKLRDGFWTMWDKARRAA
jgi:hypothetical protein